MRNSRVLAILSLIVPLGGMLFFARVSSLTHGPIAAETNEPSGPGTQLKYLSPKGYVCHRARAPLTIDGRIDEAAWQAVPWTDEFVDIEGDVKARPRLRTLLIMRCNHDYLYFAAELEETHV